MARRRQEGERAADIFIEKGFKLASLVTTLASDIVMTTEFPPQLFIDCGGASRNVDLPTADDGLTFYFQNESAVAATLTVRAPGGGATVVALSQNQFGRATAGPDGTWRGVIY